MSRIGDSVMNNVKTTMELLGNGMNCSQAILAAFGKQYGLDAGIAKMLGRPLGGGMGHMAVTCGAVTAAVLVLGLAKNGQTEADARELSHASVQELFQRFKELHGSTDCRDLLGFDMSTEEGSKKIKEEQLTKKRCPEFVRSAATILENILA